ncbi:Grx4 family monothiol glutaredoxin [Buchnera aphidicola (Ceratoglyphina bambusae)]|uniref:Grx4 family monothiol glutaredoxin n=1 Tax=Buchnera aphidicola TaxID=9 RepID=UPI0031B80F84
MNALEKIKNQIKKNSIILYMKGSIKYPSCGFSAKACEIISMYTTKCKYIDVLKNPDIRKELPIFSNWPTFPQLWINGKLVGGCDIIIKLSKTGELKRILQNL